MAMGNEKREGETHNQLAFVGLLVYVLAQAGVVYYLLWMVVGYAEINDESWPGTNSFIKSVRAYFPRMAYRAIVPCLVLGIPLLYYGYVWVVRRVKVAQNERKVNKQRNQQAKQEEE